MARFAQTLDDRDAQLRSLLDNAAKATGVLAKRTDQIVSLVGDTNALLAQLRTQSAALDQIWTNISAVARQLQGLHRRQPTAAAAGAGQAQRGAGDRRRPKGAHCDRRSQLLNSYAMSLGESLSSGPFFKAYVVNLLPGQFVQPFINAAFSDLGLDPATLLPSQLTDPPTGQPGTPPLPMPYPRTGQGGEPRLNLPDAITGNPGDRLVIRTGVPPDRRRPHPPVVRRQGRPRQRHQRGSRDDEIATGSIRFWRLPSPCCSSPASSLQCEPPTTPREPSWSPTSTTAKAYSPVTTCRSVACRWARSSKSNRSLCGSKISFWFDRKYQVPGNANAAILSPQLVTGRAIQLTPPYTGGPAMGDGAVIPQERTVVPVEWDDLRTQLQRLTELLKPTEPGGVSTLGALINTAADNLRGQGSSIRDTIIKLSQAVSALGDHSKDIFATLKNLSTLVTALHDSADLLEQLNHNLAAVSSLLADDPNKVAAAAEDLNAVVADVQSFATENREAIGTASDKLTSITTALVGSLDDIKQTLHIGPTVLQNFNNIFEPANGALTGALAGNNMDNPLAFLCGAIQAASRLGGEQAAKLCVQYMAPIVKNRQYNFPPLGENLFVGAQARPNEVTYSEDWMRPDFVPAATNTPPPAAGAAAIPTVSTDPAAGLRGLMLPPGGG